MAAPRKLKVYRWLSFRLGKQVVEIVAATSQIAAASKAGFARPSQMFGLAAVGNSQATAQALSAPGVVFWRPIDDHSGVWNKRGVEP